MIWTRSVSCGKASSKTEIAEYHLGTVAADQLAARVQVSPDIDRDWLKEYYAGHPNSFLKDYIAVQPVITFSSRIQDERMPFSSLLAKLRHNQAVEAAQELVAGEYVTIDTETTGLSESAQVVSIGVVGKDVNFYSLIKPTCPISPAAQAIHHITEDMVAEAPTIADVIPVIQSLVSDKRLTAYNAPFDRRILAESARAHGIQSLPGEWTCLMRLYLQYADLLKRNWNLPARVLGLNNVEGPLHNALTDARLAYRLGEAMAMGSLFEIEAPVWGKNIPVEERPAYTQQRMRGLLGELYLIREQKRVAEQPVSAEVKRIEAQEKKAVAPQQAQYDELLARAKENVSAIGESVKSKTSQMLYYSRHTWNIDGILRHIHDHPEEKVSRLAAAHIEEQVKVTFVQA